MDYINSGEQELINLLKLSLDDNIDDYSLSIEDRIGFSYKVYVNHFEQNSTRIIIDRESQNSYDSVAFSLKLDENDHANIEIVERGVKGESGKSNNITRKFKAEGEGYSALAYTVNRYTKDANGLVTDMNEPLYFYDSKNDECYYSKSKEENISFDNIEEKLSQIKTELQNYLGSLSEFNHLSKAFEDQKRALTEHKINFKNANDNVLETTRKWSNFESDELFLIADRLGRKMHDDLEVNKGKDKHAALLEKLKNDPELLESMLEKMSPELMSMLENMTEDNDKKKVNGKR